MIFLPHPRAGKSSAEAVRICHDAAVKAGAPFGVLQCIVPSKENSSFVMHHPDIREIIATGGPGMVKAAYSSSHPAIGVGAGNAAILVDETADLLNATSSIVLGKSFDNGTICASEQSVVVLESVFDKVKKLFQQRGVHFVEGDDRKKLGNYMIQNGQINADIVGQSAQTIASRLDIKVSFQTCFF